MIIINLYLVVNVILIFNYTYTINYGISSIINVNNIIKILLAKLKLSSTKNAVLKTIDNKNVKN